MNRNTAIVQKENSRALTHAYEFIKFINIPGAQKKSLSYIIVKRLMDIGISLCVIFLTWPIMLYIGIKIRRKLSVSGIFKQTRIKQNRRNAVNSLYFRDEKSNKFVAERRGKSIHCEPPLERRKIFPFNKFFLNKNSGRMEPDARRRDLLGQPFTFYKFRTMYPDARKRFPKMYRYKYSPNEIKTLKFKTCNDPRVPEWAQSLRKSSLDELPNFINVLRGDMSIVGPRPDIPEMVRYYSEDQKIKLDVKPGITGLAQIKGRGHLSFQDTLKYDIEYVRNRSLLLDIKIIVKTILATSNGHGAF